MTENEKSREILAKMIDILKRANVKLPPILAVAEEYRLQAENAANNITPEADSFALMHYYTEYIAARKVIKILPTTLSFEGHLLSKIKPTEMMDLRNGVNGINGVDNSDLLVEWDGLTLITTNISSQETAVPPVLPKPGLYRHFRNRQLYRLLFIARRSEEPKFDCIYMPLYEEGQKHCYPAQVMSRPAEMWEQIVSIQEGDDTRSGPRFHRIGD